MRATRLTALSVAAAVTTGCGGTDESSATPETVVETCLVDVERSLGRTFISSGGPTDYLAVDGDQIVVSTAGGEGLGDNSVARSAMRCVIVTLRAPSSVSDRFNSLDFGEVITETWGSYVLEWDNDLYMKGGSVTFE